MMSAVSPSKAVQPTRKKMGRPVGAISKARICSPAPDSPLVDSKTIAEMLGVSIKVYRRRFQNAPGHPKPFGIGFPFTYRKAEIIRWIGADQMTDPELAAAAEKMAAIAAANIVAAEKRQAERNAKKPAAKK